MYRTLRLLLCVLVFLTVTVPAEVNDQIITLYERVTDLQERVHRQEDSTVGKAQIQNLQTQILELQTRVQQAPATPQAATPQATAPNLEIVVNHIWVILCGILIMLMQLGFAFVEAGLTRSKSTVHTLTMNLMDYGVGMIAFWAIGFALMFGGVGAIPSLGINGSLLNHSLGIQLGGQTFGFLGLDGFFLAGLTQTPVMTFFFFQMVFAATANTICSGTLAERWRLPSFFLSSVFMAGFVYPLFGSWVWGGGWLQKLGYLDFAGSTVVHAAGGIIAFAGALTIGARNGKFNAQGRARAIPGHNLPYTFLGTFILAFGWFAFNAGSSLRAGSDLGLVVVNTALASAAGSITGILYSWKKFGKPDPTFACNGMLAGLVAITAGCAYVAPWAAIVIGSIAGFLVVASALYVEEKLKIDDPVGAISVHAVNGIWGGLAVGIFALPQLAGRAGLVYGGTMQILIQLVGAFSAILFFFVTGKIMFFVIGLLTRHRASDAEQEEGLDITEMGTAAYNEE